MKPELSHKEPFETRPGASVIPFFIALLLLAIFLPQRKIEKVVPSSYPPKEAPKGRPLDLTRTNQADPYVYEHTFSNEPENEP